MASADCIDFATSACRFCHSNTLLHNRDAQSSAPINPNIVNIYVVKLRGVTNISLTCYQRTWQPIRSYHASAHFYRVERDVKVWIIRSILHGRCICSLGFFPFQRVVHNWSIKDCGMCCPVCGKVHIKAPLLLISKSSLCGDSRFPLKKCVAMTMLDVQ